MKLLLFIFIFAISSCEKSEQNNNLKDQILSNRFVLINMLIQDQISSDLEINCRVVLQGQTVAKSHGRITVNNEYFMKEAEVVNLLKIKGSLAEGISHSYNDHYATISGKKADLIKVNNVKLDVENKILSIEFSF